MPLKYQPKTGNHQPKISIAQQLINNMNIISIEDKGIGIEQAKLDEIFLPFKRFHTSAEYEGTGLGMSIVSKVVEKHKGKIKASSMLGKGSKFEIYLPVSPELRY